MFYMFTHRTVKLFRCPFTEKGLNCNASAIPNFRLPVMYLLTELQQRSRRPCFGVFTSRRVAYRWTIGASNMFWKTINGQCWFLLYRTTSGILGISHGNRAQQHHEHRSLHTKRCRTCSATLSDSLTRTNLTREVGVEQNLQGRWEGQPHSPVSPVYSMVLLIIKF